MGRVLVSLAVLVSLLVAMVPSTAGTARALTGSIFTSQLGFAPNDIKIAVLAVPTGTPVDLSSPPFVIKTESGAVAYNGQITAVRFYPNGWIGNNSTGDTYLLDFTAWTAMPGRYVVESSGIRSLPFEVGPNVYDVRRVRPLEFFRVQQSGVSTSWQSLDGAQGGHGPDHLDDAGQATRQDKGGGDRRLIEQDYLQLTSGHLNAVGGWFDAGDYNKYMGNTPWAAYLLLLTYEESSAHWAGVDTNGNGQPDLLEYVRPALEWMLKMRHSDGSVYERVFNGYTAAFDGRPDLETNNISGTSDDRPLDTDRYADITAKSVYALATAYRVTRDPRYLAMAVDAWDWAYANQGTVKPQRYGGGLYFGDVEIGLTIGAIELHRALALGGGAPDPKYLQYASEHVRNHLSANNWINPSSWDYQQSYALMRYHDFASDADKARIVDQLSGRWDAGALYQGRNAYRMNDEWLYSNFGQNDLSASSAGDALWVFARTGQRQYYDYAVNQMAWIFGRNPFGESWLSSAAVSEYTRIPHWRATAKHAIEGVVVPGATDWNGNHVPDYSDTGEWYYSEPTINQQAMFVRVMTSLFQASGGSGPPPPSDLPPSVSVISPSDGGVISGTVAVRASAGDDVGVDEVVYQVGSGSVVPMNLDSGNSKSGMWVAQWNTTGIPDGLYLLTVTATDSSGQHASTTITVNVNNGSSPRLHVERIDLSTSTKGGSPNIQAKCDILVLDAFARPVSGATVRAHWEKGATDAFTGTTDGSGIVTDYSNSARYFSGITFTLVVDNVEKAGWVYDQASNKETSDSITAP